VQSPQLGWVEIGSWRDGTDTERFENLTVGDLNAARCSSRATKGSPQLLLRLRRVLYIASALLAATSRRAATTSMQARGLQRENVETRKIRLSTKAGKGALRQSELGQPRSEHEPAL
jgi:hypothetical protein